MTTKNGQYMKGGDKLNLRMKLRKVFMRPESASKSDTREA